MPWLVGFAREELDWYPTIDPAKCVKCGMCMNCGRQVYEWKADRPIVVRPYACQPGCTTCETLCLGDAISFPDREYIREVYRREGIWPKVKQALIEEGKITTS